MAKYSFRAPMELQEKIEKYCEEYDVSITALIRKALEAFFGITED